MTRNLNFAPSTDFIDIEAINSPPVFSARNNSQTLAMDTTEREKFNLNQTLDVQKFVTQLDLNYVDQSYQTLPTLSPTSQSNLT